MNLPNIPTLSNLKKEFFLGLSKKGLIELNAISPSTKVLIRYRTSWSDERTYLTAKEALLFAAKLESTNFKSGYIRDINFI